VSAAVETQPRPLTLSERLTVALPLASVYVWLCIVYAVEAWKRATPWLFTDELEFTQLSRAIAATGHAARRGEPHSFRSLYIVLLALPWRIHDVAVAFATIKYLDVLIMTSVLFPTYFLARFVVGRTPALLAAAGAAMIPSLAYSSWIVEETLAYPYSALCFFLTAKALLTRSRKWAVGAAVVAAIAPLVKGELGVIPVAVALSIFFMWWTTPAMRARRATWTPSDWLGAFALAAGAIILVSGLLSHHSREWLMNTSYNWTKKRIFVFGDWAAGALAIGLGILPFVIGLAGLVPVRGEPRTRELRVFRCVATSGVILLGLYGSMKGAYLSQVFASRVEERNLIYICPLLFVATAYVLSSRRINLWALGTAGAYALYLIAGTPFFIGGGLYSDALGLAILQQANRYWLLGPTTAQWILIAVLVVSVVGTILVARLPRGAATLAALLGVGALAWTMTGEIAAAAGDVTVSRDIRPTLGEPFTWVDDATHLKPTLYLAQGVTDQNPEWLLEFWNRSITSVSSLDGTVGGPGPSGAPNILPNGRLYWTTDPAVPGKVFDYGVEDWPCIDFVGRHVGTHFYRGGATQLRQWRLVELTKPNMLRAACVGIYADGWSGPNDSTYFRFVARRPGWLRVTLARPGFRGSPVDLQLTTIELRENSPVVGRVLRHRRVLLPHNGRKVVWIRTPASSFAIHAEVNDKFVPSQLSPSSGDVRTLGAQVGYHWFLTKRQ
jgi:hypothetical protein